MWLMGWGVQEGTSEERTFDLRPELREACKENWEKGAPARGSKCKGLGWTETSSARILDQAANHGGFILKKSHYLTCIYMSCIHHIYIIYKLCIHYIYWEINR
jgi:hypothetical protein